MQNPGPVTQRQTPPQQQVPLQQAPVQTSIPTAPVQQATPSAMVPTATVSYTLDDLARAGMTLMDSGRQGDLLQLLNQFGVDALPALSPDQYGAFATALRGMGTQI